jgi:hypothetical protein
MSLIPDATGRLVQLLPADTPDNEITELLGLIRVGLKFSNQWRGRKRGPLFYYMVEVVSKLTAQQQPVNFENLIAMLKIDARRCDLLGEAASPVSRINEEFESVVFHFNGEKIIAYGTLRNILTKIKKDIHSCR